MPALIVSYSSAPGGSERLLLDVADGFEQPPLIACPPGWLRDEARGAGFTVFTLRERSLHLRGSRRDRVAAGLRVGGHAREVRRLCRDLRPDVLVAWGMRSGLAAAAGLRGVDQRWIFEHVDFLPSPAVGRAVRAAAARADRVVCISEAIARDLDPAETMRERIEVIHCGVDLALFGDWADPAQAAHADVARAGAARAGSAGAARADPGADVLLLGAIVPWKRPELALEIAALAASEIAGLRLRVAGAPLDPTGEAQLARLRERAAEPDLDGRVEFTGRLPDPRGALRDAACLLHCADREPFGLVLVEALASGTPVVAPAAGGPAEIVDSSCGALYPPGHAPTAAAALVRTIRERDALSKGARVRAEKAFSLAVMQARYRELLLAGDARAAAGGAGARKGSDPRSVQIGGLTPLSFAFVTVTHNSAEEVARLAASIDRHLPGARLIVVDNASGDDSVAVAEAAGATVIARHDNAGFGVAANQGVAAVTEPVTVLVNPDVELVDASLAALAERAQPGELLAPLLLNEDGSRQDSVHPRPASAATLLYALLPGAALPGPLRPAVEPWRSTKPRRVAWATAACLVATTETLRDLGPFDPSIFLYAEDLDLGLRAPRTTFHPEAQVIHSRAHSTSRAFGGENYDLLARQRRAVVQRNLGPRRAILDDVTELMTFADRALVRRLGGRSARRETERFRARLRAAVKR